MPSILFRADAERSIGVGDLMSSIYISKHFEKNSWRTFFIVRDYLPAMRIISERNMKNVYLIAKEASIDDEIDLIRMVCREEAIDCLFMQVTKTSLCSYEKLGRPAPLKVCVNFDGVVTDDFDMVINWCATCADEVYREHRERDRMCFLLGFDKAILPDTFDWEKIAVREPAGRAARRILVSMGGVDEFGLTHKILRALGIAKNDLELRVVAGPGFADYRRLFEFSSGVFKDFSIQHNAASLFEDYMWADLAFSAGGLTSSELVASKTPAVLIASYEHQVRRCEHYAQKGWAHYAGFHRELSSHKITQALEQMAGNIEGFRKNLSNADFRGGNEEIFKNIDSRR